MKAKTRRAIRTLTTLPLTLLFLLVCVPVTDAAETKPAPPSNQRPIANQNQFPPEQQLNNEPAQQGNQTQTSSLSVTEANAIETTLVADVDTATLSANYPIVDTGETAFYSNDNVIREPDEGDRFYGQDATYSGNQPSYTDNRDGTVTDNVTGLMWQQDPGEKMTWSEAVEMLNGFELAGYTDWRLPTIKELYSLIDFSGQTNKTPFINTDYFVFSYGDATGERSIDSQYATSTIYESDTMGGQTTMFGVNFADGRIKGYPIDKEFYVMLVRGRETYGLNNFVDNGDGTITDLSTGLMWMMYDSGYLEDDGAMNWEDALDWAENLDYAGYTDWKLPNAKELQSIVDYTRSPDTTHSAAIDPLFQATEIETILSAAGYAYYWTSTTHLDGRNPEAWAVYVSFGEALGDMNGNISDVHGAGSQKGDPKAGSEADTPYASEQAPQGDVISVYNLVRAVRVID